MMLRFLEGVDLLTIPFHLGRWRTIMFGPYKYIISVDFMEYKKRQSSEHNTMKTGVHNRPQAMIGALYYSPFIMLLLSTQVHPLAAADCHKQNRDPQTWSMFFPPPPRIYVVFFPPPPGIYGFFFLPFLSFIDPGNNKLVDSSLRRLDKP